MKRRMLNANLLTLAVILVAIGGGAGLRPQWGQMIVKPRGAPAKRPGSRRFDEITTRIVGRGVLTAPTGVI